MHQNGEQERSENQERSSKEHFPAVVTARIAVQAREHRKRALQ